METSTSSGAEVGDLGDRLVGQLSVVAITAEERHQQLFEWNATEAEFPMDVGVHELVAAQAARTPHEIAVVSSSDHLSYAELDDYASRLGHYLRQCGVGPDQQVGICLERSVDMAVALLAVLKAGGSYLPLDPQHPAERIAGVIDDAHPVLIVTTARLRARLPSRDVPLLLVDSDRSTWIDSAAIRTPVSGSGNLAYLVYTSGSTGEPKGVMIEHRAIVNQLIWRARAFGLGPGDRVLQKAPLGFDVSVWELFCPLICGATVVMLEPGAQRDPRRLSAAIGDERITLVSFAPSMLQWLVDEGELEGWSAMRLVAVGGETLLPALVEKVFERLGDGVTVVNLYGPTEATIVSTWWRCRRGDAVVPIGRPIANTQVYLLDANMNLASAGVAAELFIGGVGLARGYFKRPDLTEERFVPNPFRPGERIYRTGDFARWRQDGTLEYLGRLDDQVKIRGNYLELGEVEAALQTHESVERALVLPRPDGAGVPQLVAYVVGKRDQRPPARAELRAHLAKVLPDYMIPSAFVTIDAIPLASNGKVDRKALPVPVFEVGMYVAPRSPMEAQLAARFAQVLGLERVSVEEDFFLLGGHSLLAARVLGEVESDLGIRESLAEVFMRRATVAALASAIESVHGDHTVGGAVPLSLSDGSVPTLFFVHPGESAMLTLRHFVSLLGREQPVRGLLPPRVGRRFERASSVEQLASALLGTIRDAQPHGPYFVAGFSLGGLVAYEIAGQLSEEGEVVAWLGVFDASNSPIAADGMLWSRSPRGLVMHVLQFGPVQAARAAKRLVWRWVRATLVRIHWLPVEADAFDYHGAAVLTARYKPRGHAAPMQLFASADSIRATGSPTLGWEQVHRGPITQHVLAGDHMAMMTEPYVRVAAQLARESLLRARSALPVDAG